MSRGGDYLALFIIWCVPLSPFNRLAVFVVTPRG
uniref:Uncharacterized protein n=1 Tax=Anguilla anguilla TaxID=7936 RepID=A0A0E9T6V0_ANGAN